MRLRRRWWTGVLLATLACGAEEAASSPPGVAGASSVSVAGASGGAQVQAGTSAGGAGGASVVAPAAAMAGAQGGTASGGVSGALGSAAGRGGSSAGTGAGGMDASRAGAGAGGTNSAGSASAGNASNGGAGAGSGGAGAAASGAKPSAGCTKNAGRPANGLVMQSDRIYSFPTQYDGTTPMPFLLALHAAGNPNTQLQNLTKGSKLETEFVRAFPKSAGNAWVYSTDIAKLKAVIDDVLANYCVDTDRMFATGHSSGAQMIVQMLCNGEMRFKAVAPVAASKYCAKFSPVAVMYIQGRMDAQRGGGNGKDVVDMFAASNACGTATMAKTDVPSCTSTFDRQPVTPGCVTYEGCAAPTVWCSHNDNGYNNTDGRQHGWPCFASSAIAEFFLGR